MLLEMTDIYLLKKDKYKPYVSKASAVKIYIEENNIPFKLFPY